MRVCVLVCVRWCACCVAAVLAAARYLVRDYLGSAAFSSALSCEDLVEDRDVCLKVGVQRGLPTAHARTLSLV